MGRNAGIDSIGVSWRRESLQAPIANRQAQRFVKYLSRAPELRWRDDLAAVRSEGCPEPRERQEGWEVAWRSFISLCYTKRYH